MLVIERDTIAEAWLDAAQQLLDGGGDAFTGIVHVRQPGAQTEEGERVRGLLDEYLQQKDFYDTQTVANTIFPEFLASLADENAVYERYRVRLWPRLRRMKGNTRGTYFLRLIGDGGNGAAGEGAVNPLGTAIEKLRTQIASGRPMRSAYELPVYTVADRKVLRGFPCLSHVSLKLDGDKLHLTGLYRNQCYVQRLYGNLLGLARLQAFAAHHAGLVPGALVCHASHAELETGGVGAFRSLLGQCRTVLNG